MTLMTSKTEYKQKETLETALDFANIIRGFAEKKFAFAHQNNCPKA